MPPPHSRGMEDTMILTIIAAVFALIGCPGDKCDTGDSGTCDSGDADTDTDTDTDTDSDADADVVATTTWSAAGLDFAIDNGDQQYSLGMAETGSTNGWYGEDCLEGPGPNSGDWDICHDSVPSTGISLATVTAPADIVANESTLFTDTIAKAGNITYLLYGNTDGECGVWGNDVTYYNGLGCTEM
jgi:hypothetical protein